MTNLPLLEDEATLYVLGRMSEAERGEFEACLAESAKLRALVRELEEGSVAIAMASPPRRVPQRVWEEIEKAVSEESRPIVLKASFWLGWLRSGWAATAACLIGWLLYVFWDREFPPDAAPSTLASEINVQSDALATHSAWSETNATSQPQNLANAERRILQTNLQATTKENGTLRFQNAKLEKRVKHLSQVVTQQQTLLSESSRLKFLQLGAPSNGAVGASNAVPSPALQRALFLAMARELGWLRSGESDQSDPTLTNQTGVDFVDLHPSTNETTPFNLQSPQIEQALTDSTESGSPSSIVDDGISGLVLDDKTILAFDPSSRVATTGSELSFWAGDPLQGFQFLGSTVIGTNITVVGFQASSATPNGTPLTVTSQGPSGFLHVIGQLPLPAPMPP